MIGIFRITSMKIIGQVTRRPVYAIPPRIRDPALEFGKVPHTLLTTGG
jgi:hypothetical protein